MAYAGLAQLVEHLNRNQRVEGSTPLAGINSFKGFNKVLFLIWRGSEVAKRGGL